MCPRTLICYIIYPCARNSPPKFVVAIIEQKIELSIQKAALASISFLFFFCAVKFVDGWKIYIFNTSFEVIIGLEAGEKLRRLCVHF